jgi:hypothetical protein
VETPIIRRATKTALQHLDLTVELRPETLKTRTHTSMDLPTLMATQGLRIAVEGCGHGTLHAIYASVAKSCELKQWPGVDLLIIGGDFQVR